MKDWIKSIFPKYDLPEKISYKSAKGINGNPSYVVDGILSEGKILLDLWQYGETTAFGKFCGRIYEGRTR